MSKKRRRRFNEDVRYAVIAFLIPLCGVVTGIAISSLINWI